MSNDFVVGAGAGIGRFLVERMDAQPFLRGDSLEAVKNADTIIYCAASARFETPLDMLYRAMEDNLLLLERVTRLPHKRFVYFSSIDVYPRTGGPHHEDDMRTIEALPGGYASFKLMGEAMVLERCTAPLILRPASLFGPGMRPNNIMRLLQGDPAGLSLTRDARFNCVTYDMIAELIAAALAQSISGTFNCASASTISLGDVAKMCGYEGPFGDHDYCAPDVANDKACALVPAYGRSSARILEDVRRHI